MSFLCLIGIHNFDKWKVITKYKITKPIAGVIGDATVQETVCKRCGFRKTHMEKTMVSEHYNY